MVESLEIQTQKLTDNDLAKFIEILLVNELCYEDVPKLRETFSKVTYGEEVAGYFGIEKFGSVGLLRSVVMTDQMRGKGVGKRLLDAAFAQSISLQLESLYLLTNTAEGFFAKFGFEVVERKSAPESVQESHEFKSFCPDSAVCMVKHFDNE